MSVTSVPFGPAAVQHHHCMYDSSRLILSHRLAPPSLLFFLSCAAHIYCLTYTYIAWVLLRTFLNLTSFSNRGLSPHRTPVCRSPSTTVLDFASSAYVYPDPSTLDRVRSSYDHRHLRWPRRNSCHPPASSRLTQATRWTCTPICA